MNERQVNLTSSEIASLWTGYMNDSMLVCVLGFMLKDIEDSDIKSVVQQAYDYSANHLEQLTAIFEEENMTIPNGFAEQDVNMDAPWLFNDVFCLTYMNHMARAGMIIYSGFVGMSYREDIYHYFSQGLKEQDDIYGVSLKIAMQKGVNARHPNVEIDNKTEYVEGKNYLSGLNPFSNKRPINTVEMSHLYLNILTNEIGAQTCIAFAQTSPSQDVQNYMLRAKNISQKHVTIFTNILTNDNIQVSNIPNIGISNSTTPTFSDKLLMFHVNLLITAGMGNYSTSASASQRSDLGIKYERLSFEVARLAKSGADIMIKHHWLEQPPGMKDRKDLAKGKDKS